MFLIHSYLHVYTVIYRWQFAPPPPPYFSLLVISFKFYYFLKHLSKAFYKTKTVCSKWPTTRDTRLVAMGAIFWHTWATWLQLFGHTTRRNNPSKTVLYWSVEDGGREGNIKPGCPRSGPASTNTPSWRQPKIKPLHEPFITPILTSRPRDEWVGWIRPLLRCFRRCNSGSTFGEDWLVGLSCVLDLDLFMKHTSDLTGVGYVI